MCNVHLTEPIYIFFIFQGMQQGAMNQMGNPMPQGPFVGMNQMHSGPPSGGPPLGGFPNNLPNMQGPSNTNYPQGASFNRPQGGQMPMMQGYNPYQVR